MTTHAKSQTTRSEAIQTGQGEEGVALVLALLFVVLLTALVVDFNYEMQVAASSVGNHTSELQAYLAAKSAVAAGMGMLATDLFEGEELAALGQAEDVFDSYEDLWSEGIPISPINDAIMQCTIDDEYGKINLNALVFSGGGEEDDIVFEPLEEMLRVLFENRGMDLTPVDAIIDWLDSDDEVTDPDGYEFDYYESLENPFGCKNGVMDSIDELLLIPGITPEMYFGLPEEGVSALPDLLTVHGHPQGKININTANFEVLEAFFTIAGHPDPLVSADETLLRIQEEGPFSSRAQLQQMDLADADDPDTEPREEDEEAAGGFGNTRPGDLLEWTSSVFRVRGDGESGESQVRVEAYIWRDTFNNGAAQTFRVIDWRVYR